MCTRKFVGRALLPACREPTVSGLYSQTANLTRVPHFSRPLREVGIREAARFPTLLAPISDSVLCWHHFELLVHGSYAPPDRQILAPVRAGRNSCSPGVSRHGCASACLLPPQVSPPVPRDRNLGSGPALSQQYRLLQPRLLPRRDHIPVRASPDIIGVGRRARR
jgi:hypothetical protein